jgi:hypothetical protein
MSNRADLSICSARCCISNLHCIFIAVQRCVCLFSQLVFQSRVLLRAYTLRFLTPEQKATMQRMYDSVGRHHHHHHNSRAVAAAPTEGIGLGPLKSSTAVDMEYLPLVQVCVHFVYNCVYSAHYYCTLLVSVR